MDAGDIFRMLYWVNSIIAICITVKVVLANRNPVTTFAWIFVLLFLPYIGLALYFFFGRDTRKRKYIRRRFLSQIKQKAQPVCNTSGDVYIPAEYMRISSYYKSTPKNCFARIPTRNETTATVTLISVISKNLGLNFSPFATEI